MRLTSVGKSTGTTLMEELAVALVLTMRLCSSTSIQEMKDTVQLKVSLSPSMLVAERHGQAMPIAASTWAVSPFCHSTMPFFSNSYKRLPHVESSQINCLTFFQKTGANQRSYIEAATKMSARGGRGGFARGGLKGATWEHDPGVKLESAPSELFPVCQLESLTQGNHTNRSRNTPISLLLHP
jgi:hypothetical protein